MELTKLWVAQIDDYVIDLAWSPDGALLAAASASGPIALVSSADGARAHDLPGHEGGTNVLAWGPAGGSGSTGIRQSLFASGGQDGAVKFWDAGAGQHTATAELGAGWVEQLAWGAPGPAAACGRRFALLNPDGSTRFTPWEAPKSVSALAWRPGGAGNGAPGCVAAAFFGGVRLFNSGDFSVAKEFPYGNGIQALAWSPDGKWLVSGNQDPSVHLWVPDRDEELQMSGFEGKVRHLSFDHASRWLATSGGVEVSVWDCTGDGPAGREPAMLAHEAPVTAVAFQGRHGLIATASRDGSVRLWSPERPRPLRATISLPSAATRIAWSPDDRRLAIGSDRGFVYALGCPG